MRRDATYMSDRVSVLRRILAYSKAFSLLFEPSRRRVRLVEPLVELGLGLRVKLAAEGAVALPSWLGTYLRFLADRAAM